ncbi:MAG TPA: WecB/TagA/CpsF family glycosyltransferase [Caldimonas sp.]|nr:WecB/TagA/CpsF family glycosyltransferase [Caldimonas sp.]HEX2542207.1 WecB/TagA/CpsF family glycosyltransferase [Caldimonas sp.]
MTVASPAPARPPRVRQPLLNAWIDDLTMDELMGRLERGALFTLNPNHLYYLQRDRHFEAAYSRAEFVTCDSGYLFWALRLMGRRIRARLAGSDIVPAFCRHHCDDPAVRIFLLGAASGVAQRALERINARTGRDICVGAHGPSMNFVNDEAEIQTVLHMIEGSGATVLIVGLGAPKQEIWIDRYRGALPQVRIFMGVGATIDYEAGVVARAPLWMRRMGLEWLYRVVTDPRRYLLRYARDAGFLWLVLLDALGLYKGPSFSNGSRTSKS